MKFNYIKCRIGDLEQEPKAENKNYVENIVAFQIAQWLADLRLESWLIYYYVTVGKSAKLSASVSSSIKRGNISSYLRVERIQKA